MRVLTARALDTDVSVASDDERVLDGVRAVMATYPPALGEPTLRYVLDVARAIVFRNGEELAAGFAAASFAPYFERDLYDVVIERAAPSLLVHGAVVVRDGVAILLFGASGAGKTTTCRALVARGARYVTDEIAAIDAESRARGLPRPLSLGPASPPHDPAAHALRGHMGSYRFVARDGSNVEAPLFALSAECVVHEPVPIAAIVHLRHDPNAPEGGRRLSSAEALPLLWAERLRTHPGELELAITLLQRVSAFEVVTRSVEGAVRDIDALTSER